jgi:4-diphosphocytidyl-2-C-methyl-D-erythritol kinase
MLKNAISLWVMILFSPAKINLGLLILERRADGFHNLQSVMYPTPLCDILEIHQLSEEDKPVRFSQTGIRFKGDLEKNLCIRAWDIMASEGTLPNVAIHLHKQIPVGAGLGGGSSNASTILKGLNLMASSPASPERLAELSARLGSDCPFFLHSNPMMMEGRGELLSPVKVSLDSFYLVLLFPEIQISTSEAYGTVSPAKPDLHLGQLIKAPLDQWKNSIFNRFEESVFPQYPLLKELKHALYRAGAIYASMSGSGSALYGIFESPPVLPEDIKPYIIWEGAA